jgi:hypothetical protein
MFFKLNDDLKEISTKEILVLNTILLSISEKRKKILMINLMIKYL